MVLKMSEFGYGEVDPRLDETLNRVVSFVKGLADKGERASLARAAKELEIGRPTLNKKLVKAVEVGELGGTLVRQVFDTVPAEVEQAINSYEGQDF